MDISDDESGKEEKEEETNTGEAKQVVIGSCITFNICRIYKRKKAKSKYEIGTLHPGNKVDYSKEESGGGWFKALAPIRGWIQYSELTPPELTEQEKETLSKKKAKVIDLTDESSIEDCPEAQAKDSKESEEDINGTKKVNDGKIEEVAVNGTTNGKTTKDKEKVNDKVKEDDIETVEVESIESEIEEECTDDDWDEFEDPDEENLSGNWSCGPKGGCFTLNQTDDGVLDGYLVKKETCSIDGKVEGDNIIFNQKWQKGSVHGVGVVTVVKGTHSDRMRTMNVKFECTNTKGKKITGKNVLHKYPACDLTGIWYAQEDKLGCFVFKMSSRGDLQAFWTVITAANFLVG